MSEQVAQLERERKERDSCYSGNAQNGTSSFIPEHSWPAREDAFARQLL